MDYRLRHNKEWYQQIFHCILEVIQLGLRLPSLLILVSSLSWGVGDRLFVCVLTKQRADGSTENRCRELLLWSFRWIFSFISYTTKLLRKSHMHGYLSKKLLLNITIVLRNVLCLLIQLFALCWCSGLLWAFCDWAWELRAGRVLVWPLMEAAEENCLNWDWITYICYV